MLLSAILGRLSTAFVFIAIAGGSPTKHLSERNTIDDFISKQRDVSVKGILANVGPDGPMASGASAGVLVASPSRSNPNYFSTWTRDSALTFKALIERFVAGDTSLRTNIDQYISAQAKIQNVSNPSGFPGSGGLGEPRFNVDISAFTASWGRPQRDGPALRATALTIYANWLIENGGGDQARDTVWPIIAKDLAYTVLYWNQTGFDLWEETTGSSFFTLSASHRALIEGENLATSLGKSCDGCAAAAPQVLCFMQSFWTGSYINSNINTNEYYSRTGKDANSILSSIHTFDPAADCTDATFQPCSSRALANLKTVADSFRSVYVINNGLGSSKAVAIGRYSEDVYYNGNPWYLTTLAAAEQLYSAAYQWKRQGSITVTDVSLPFLRDLLPSISTGTYSNGSSTYTSILSAVSTYADEFVTIVKSYTPANGTLAEQFDRNTGSPLSATDLTWSYAAFLTSTDRRAGTVGPSWGESASNKSPSTCTGTPVCTSLTFKTSAATTSGENVFVVGQLDQLYKWNTAQGVPLTYSYSAWSGDISLPAGTPFEYKYIKKNSSGQVVWSSGSNYVTTTSTDCGSSATVDDSVVWE